MKKLHRILRSSRGDVLVDAMVSAVVVGVIIAVVTGAMIILGQTSVNNSNNTARSVTVKNLLSAAVPAAETMTSTPIVTDHSVLDKTVKVAMWRETDTNGSLIYASAPRYDQDSADCADVDRADGSKCITHATRVGSDVGGISLERYPVVAGTSGATYQTSTKIPGTTGEIRYVFKVTGVTADSTLTFTSENPGAKFTVDIPAGATGYYYGSIEVNDAPAAAVAPTTLFMTKSGPVTFDDTSFLIYGAP